MAIFECKIGILLIAEILFFERAEYAVSEREILEKGSVLYSYA